MSWYCDQHGLNPPDLSGNKSCCPNMHRVPAGFRPSAWPWQPGEAVLVALPAAQLGATHWMGVIEREAQDDENGDRGYLVRRWSVQLQDWRRGSEFVRGQDVVGVVDAATCLYNETMSPKVVREVCRKFYSVKYDLSGYPDFAEADVT